MIKKIISIKDYTSFSSGETWGLVYGMVSGQTEYYTGQTLSNAYIATVPILLTQNIDDIGFYTPYTEEWKGETIYKTGDTVLYNENTYVCKVSHTGSTSFNNNQWEITPESNISYNISYTGETKINEFRRYGKSDDDPDLYNPIWNTGFTHQITSSNGMIYKIISETEREDGLGPQNLYGYQIWPSGYPELKFNYQDIDSQRSSISYTSSGFTANNSIESNNYKKDELIGVVEDTKTNIDVFIERGLNSSFDRHLKLGEARSFVDLLNYGNGYFKIKET